MGILTLSTALTLHLLEESKAWIADAWPLHEHQWRGVQPYLSDILTSNRLLATSCFTTSAWPLLADLWRAVRPFCWERERERGKSSFQIHTNCMQQSLPVINSSKALLFFLPSLCGFLHQLQVASSPHALVLSLQHISAAWQGWSICLKAQTLLGY